MSLSHERTNCCERQAVKEAVWGGGEGLWEHGRGAPHAVQGELLGTSDVYIEIQT